jgi:ribosome-associated heat shock protein Hsp15
MRLDKWLWTVRVFKTRTLATEAIKGGHVKIDGVSVKPAHEARVGELIQAHVADMNRTLKVLGFPNSRVAAKLVPQFAEDLTPESEKERQRQSRLFAPTMWPKGQGRPTKRDRRRMERIDLPPP